MKWWKKDDGMYYNMDSYSSVYIEQQKNGRHSILGELQGKAGFLWDVLVRDVTRPVAKRLLREMVAV